MILGTETGSLVNYVLSDENQPDAYVGMPATILGWTDRYPGTVIKLFKVGKSSFMHIQADNFTAIPKEDAQYGEHIDYTYSPNPNGSISTYRQNANGTWRAVRLNADTRRWIKSGGRGIYLGEREKYWDPSF